MLHHQFAVQARFRPEAPERILRVIRHRGFQICTMNMSTAVSDGCINLELTIAGSRPIELLFNQLTKLVDVTCVEVQQTTSQFIRA